MKNRIKKTTVDLLNNIYSVAYWMTENENDSQNLVKKIYSDTKNKSSETELLKTLRTCYISQFGQSANFCISEQPWKTNLQLINALKDWAADIKLSVLIHEITGLQHQQISDIINQPIDIVRTWLLWGRKLLVNNCEFKASA